MASIIANHILGVGVILFLTNCSHVSPDRALSKTPLEIAKEAYCIAGNSHGDAFSPMAPRWTPQKHLYTEKVQSLADEFIKYQFDDRKWNIAVALNFEPSFANWSSDIHWVRERILGNQASVEMTDRLIFPSISQGEGNGKAIHRRKLIFYFEQVGDKWKIADIAFEVEYHLPGRQVSTASYRLTERLQKALINLRK